MEPLEFESRRGRKPWDRNGVRRSATQESVLLTDSVMRPGGGHPARGTGPHAPARQRYPGGTAPQWPPARPASAALTPAGQYDGARSARDEPAARGYPPRQGAMRPGRPGNGDSVSVAARILSVADYEAASITQQASLQAAMITQRVASEATEIREAARREADQLMQQASLQAAAVREAAEIEAAEVHTAVKSMQTELSELAERIRNTLPHPVVAPEPPAQPKPRPRPGPQERHTGPQERAAGRPAVRAPGKPSARAAERPVSGLGRQAAAMRFAVIATSALFMVAVVAGVMEVHLHGWKFFIFRSVGTGETGRGPGGLQENQGPGQPGAPKATPSHIKVQPSPRSTVTVHSGH